MNGRASPNTAGVRVRVAVMVERGRRHLLKPGGEAKVVPARRTIRSRALEVHHLVRVEVRVGLGLGL